ncbi:MAG: integrase core domain-containing protein [Burkholderiales bacterium]
MGAQLRSQPVKTSLISRQLLDRYFEFYNSRRPHQSHDGATPDMIYFGTLAPLANAA